MARFRGDPMVSVPCHPLSTIIAMAGMGNTSFDFLSLDVEGSEYMVLATSDLSAFKLVMVEMESANERGPEREAIRARVVGLLRAAGFTRYPRLEHNPFGRTWGINHVYVHRRFAACAIRP